MEDEKKEVVSESSETVNDKEEKKNLKVTINEFVEKKGKKKCIIVGAVTGAAIVALILGLSLGLGGCEKAKKAEIVDNVTWKARADDIVAKHSGAAGTFVYPHQATMTSKYVSENRYSDGTDATINQEYVHMVDNDNYMIYNSRVEVDAKVGDDAGRHEGQNLNIDIKTWFWLEESESCFYMVGQQGDVKRALKIAADADTIAMVKGNPNDELFSMRSSYYSDFKNKFASDLPNIDHCYISTDITQISMYLQPADFYDKYYEDMTAKGSDYIYSYTDQYNGRYNKKSLELRSAGEGSTELGFEGYVDGENEYCSEGVPDDIEYLKGTMNYELDYADYNFKHFGIGFAGSANLTYDLTMEYTVSQDLSVDYSAKIKKPSVENPTIL